jgi:hypothetical protein
LPVRVDNGLSSPALTLRIWAYHIINGLPLPAVLSNSAKKSRRRKEENGDGMEKKGEHQEEASLHITNPLAGLWLHSTRQI